MRPVVTFCGQLMGEAISVLDGSGFLVSLLLRFNFLELAFIVRNSMTSYLSSLFFPRLRYCPVPCGERNNFFLFNLHIPLVCFNLVFMSFHGNHWPVVSHAQPQVHSGELTKGNCSC